MPQVNMTISEDAIEQIDQMVENDPFLNNRSEALRKVLSEHFGSGS